MSDTQLALEEFIEGLPTGIIVLDANCNVLVWNKLAFQLLGIEVEDLLIGQFDTVVKNPPLQDALNRVKNKDAVKNDFIFEKESQFIKCTVDRLRYESGAEDRIIIIVEDASRYKQLESMKPEIHVYGVETIGADAVTKSFRSGKLERLSAITSIAKTLGAQQTTEDTLARIKISVNDMQTVTDEEALKALKFLLDEEKVLVEPATSCIVAALLENKFDMSHFEKIGIILCGANVSLRELQNWKII